MLIVLKSSSYVSVWLESWPLSPLTVSTLSVESHKKELKHTAHGFNLKPDTETCRPAGN